MFYGERGQVDVLLEFPGVSLFTRNRIKQITDKPLQRQPVLCSHVLIYLFVLIFFVCSCDRNYTLVSVQPCMFTVSALALETGGAANETSSFLIVFLVKPWLINAAKFPVCEQSAPDFRRADDSQWSAAPLPPCRAHVRLQVKQKTGCWSAFVPLCVRVCPPTLAQIAGAAFPARKESWGRQEAVGVGWRHSNSWWGAWCSPSSSCTPPVSGQVGTTRRTTLHTQTSCHPWHHHTLRCAITAGVFPALVFVAIWEILCPHLPFLSSVYIQVKLVDGLQRPAGGCCQGKLTFYIKISCLFPPFESGVPDNAEDLLQGKRSLVACCVGEACILSLAYMSFSHVFVLGTTTPPNPGGRRKGRCRHEHCQFVSAKTGYGGGGSGFGLTDLSQSHLFYGLWEAVSTLGEDLCRTLSGALPKF